MANALFTLGKQHFVAGDIDWDADDFKIVFVDHADDTPVLATDEALDDILAAARVATSGNLSSKTNVGGVVDAADETVSTVSGDQFESIVLYMDSGVEGTSYLIGYWDTATGLPCTPNGGDITVAWHASGLFEI